MPLITSVEAVERDDLKCHFLCASADLHLDICVGRGGQSFTWQPLGDGSWCNVLAGHLVIVSEEAGVVQFQSLSEPVQVRAVLVDYFRLDMHLADLYNEWIVRDPVFKSISKAGGVRVLRIDPWECLLSFICSQNNAIHRILKMVQRLKERYGRWLYTVKAKDTTVAVHAFPTLEELRAAQHLELDLRAMGFGYRAKYFASALNLVQEESRLHELRSMQYDHVIAYLTRIPGVGPKVADCVALYSLDQLSAVPIDTHMLRVALSHYCPRSSTVAKSLTLANYRRISGRLREALGPRAGWAQAVLFASQLAAFKGTT